MPGRVTARMAAGTNGLLRDGAVPVTATEDVLDELFGVGLRPERAASAGRAAPVDAGLRRRARRGRGGRRAWTSIVRRTGSLAAEVRAALGRLEADGHVVRGVLGGWERAAM